MSGLRQSSKVLNNLGSLHIVTGTITVNSGTWALTTNDATCTLTDIGAGNVSVTFGENFLAAPTVVASFLKATHEAAVVKDVLVELVNVSTAEFVVHSLDDSGAGETDIATVDPDDDDGFMFVAIGHRNN